jgi:hypothetical protein
VQSAAFDIARVPSFGHNGGCAEGGTSLPQTAAGNIGSFEG